MSVSVAMAVYNGGKYIEQQISSILVQLSDEDELVISYDKSEDNTFKIIKRIAESDKRVKIFQGPCKGVVLNFENAIRNCNNDFIFLSDQDDIWVENKVNVVLNEFNKTDADVILHDARVVDKDLSIILDSFFEARRCRKGILKNIIKNSYIGCCMAFRRRFVDIILPFPKKIPMHDQWIGILGERFGKVALLRDKLILHRRHGQNASGDSHSNLFRMLCWRFILFKNLLKHRKLDLREG